MGTMHPLTASGTCTVQKIIDFIVNITLTQEAIDLIWDHLMQGATIIINVGFFS